MPRCVRKLFWGTLASILLLALVEGLLSFFVVGRAMAHRTSLFDLTDHELVTHFDPDLGWCTNPGYTKVIAGGSGESVTVGSHGFRGARPVSAEPPSGRVRALLAGDSFTFGSGVADEDTWARVLERREPRLETVNLGVGGYGVDQIFLRYRRDGAALKHDLLVFAFITEDLLRMVIPAEWGAEKPKVARGPDGLIVSNVPVTQAPGWLRSLRQSGRFLRELRLAQVIERVAGADTTERSTLSQDEEMRLLTLQLFEELQRLAAERGAHVVLVHLPVETDRGGGSIDALAPLFRAAATRLGMDWIDLLTEFRALTAEEHAALFLRRPSLSAGHYNARGCELVGELLHAKLNALPAVANLLAERR